MRLDIDTYREILDTLTRNKSRSFLTGFGVFWGVFMLVALIGGGQGMKELLNQNFEGFATNSAMIWAQPTTKAYKGFRKGRRWDMEYKDVQRLKSRIPELEVVSPVLFSNGGTAYFGDRKTTVSINGVQEDYQRVSEPKMRYGRYLNDMDVAQRRKVCVIQKKTYKDLFPGGGDPCGSFIRVDSVYYQIVGVDYSSAEGISFGGESGTTMLLPITLMQQTYNMGQNVHMIAVTGKKGVVMSTVTDRIRETIARAHTIDPEDEQGVMVFNTEVLFQMLDNLFFFLGLFLLGDVKGVNDLFYAGFRVLLLHDQAVWRTAVHTSSALNTVHSLDAPRTRLTIYRYSVGGTCSLAHAAEHTAFYVDTDCASCHLLPLSWNDRIHQRGRFFEQAVN